MRKLEENDEQLKARIAEQRRIALIKDWPIIISLAFIFVGVVWVFVLLSER